MNLISEDYLMHYGIKGMKWGVRHDPQPSGFRKRRAANQQYRQSVKAAGKRNMQAFRENYGSRDARRAANQQFRNEVNAAKQKNKEAFKLSDKQKKILKGAALGAAVVGAGIAVYGGYKLSATRSANKAAVAKFLHNNPDIANSVLKGGKPYKPIASRIPNFSDPTRLKGGSTLSRGKITTSIKGPTLHTTRSTVNAWSPTDYGQRGSVTKMLERDAIGANGRGRIMTKEQQKYYNKLYKDYIRLYKNNK